MSARTLRHTPPRAPTDAINQLRRTLTKVACLSRDLVCWNITTSSWQTRMIIRISGSSKRCQAATVQLSLNLIFCLKILATRAWKTCNQDWVSSNLTHILSQSSKRFPKVSNKRRSKCRRKMRLRMNLSRWSTGSVSSSKSGSRSAGWFPLVKLMSSRWEKSWKRWRRIS